MIQVSKVARRRTPPASAFLGDLRKFYYWDSYEAPLTRGDLAMHQLYLGLFTNYPRWAQWLLVLRGILVAPFGLRSTRITDFDEVPIRPAYAVGDTIARFILFAQSDSEIVTGADDKHLDFRVSVCRWRDGDARRIALSTVVRPHNFFGRAYLFAILPIHRLGIRMVMTKALSAGRI